MSTIQVGGQLQPGTVDTPLDARARVDTLSAIASIPLPFIGMPFFVKETGKLYVVKSLKSRQIGPVVTENAAIDEYQEIGADSVIAGGGRPDNLTIIRPECSAAIWPVVEAYPDATFAANSRVLICNQTAHLDRVAAWSGSAWNTLTADGLTDVYANMPVCIEISSLQLSAGYFRYYWIDADGKSSDIMSLPFPSIVEPTPFHLRAVEAPEPGYKIQPISLAQYNSLSEIDLRTIYLVSGLGIVFGNVQYSDVSTASGSATN